VSQSFERRRESVTREPESTPPQYACVAVPLHVSRAFVYRLPETLQNIAQIGCRVLVPLGRVMTTGYIVALHETLPSEVDLPETSIRDAESILDSVPICTSEVLDLTRWVSDYYASPWGEVIKAALPPGISPTIDQLFVLTEEGQEVAKLLSEPQDAKIQVLSRISATGEISVDDLLTNSSPASLRKAVRDLERSKLIRRINRPRRSFVRAKAQLHIKLLDAHLEQATRLTETQRRVLEYVKSQETPSLQKVLRDADISMSVINTLVKRNLIHLFEQSVRRDPLAKASLPKIAPYDLTEQQLDVLGKIKAQLHCGSYGAFLLHGVTGSGKTEVYIRAMRATLALGRSALMLVPEIALTPVFSKRLRASFGDQIAIFHSSLPRGERFDEWMRVKHGEARVVIGTRSAVFAPIDNLGLVVVDEEHESTYRQQDSPFYNGRDTAIVKAQKASAVVILGSATPSLESFQNARSGKYQYLQMPQRIGNRPMATATLVDMREVFSRHGRPQVFSEELLEAISDTQQKKQQSIILLNRRGYSSFVLCRSCGDSVQCPNCDVTLTYHRSDRVMICHYCNHRQPPPSVCPTCGKEYIHYVGEGTEQIEALLAGLFPALRIARIDRDTTASRAQFEKSLLDFSEGRLDMLVGTQILAKGHDFPNVTLVGVVSVDAGLALPDFRAAERTFQLITQVAGRAGRGDRPGRVLIQTYHPEHYAVRHACNQDYTGFFDQEIRYRKNHGYPPFVALALLLVHGTDQKRVRSDAQQLRKELDLANRDRLCRILGPAPAPLARLKNEYRIQLLIKSTSRGQIRAVADAALKTVFDRGLSPRSVNLEIDPISIM